jgi:hypothetical protein
MKEQRVIQATWLNDTLDNVSAWKLNLQCGCIVFLDIEKRSAIPTRLECDCECEKDTIRQLVPMLKQLHSDIAAILAKCG